MNAIFYEILVKAFSGVLRQTEVPSPSGRCSDD